MTWTVWLAEFVWILPGAARAKLAVCKGTVMGKPIRTSGCINLDLKDKSSKRPVKVFFVPARTGAAGTFLKGARVQFFLGFTQEKGYEAFEVSVHWEYPSLLRWSVVLHAVASGFLFPRS